MTSANRRILVGVDASEHSDEALLQADARARTTDSELVVCTVLPNVLVVSPFLTSMRSTTNMVAMRETAVAALGERVSRLTRRTAAEFRVRVLDGMPHAALVLEAEQMGADLLVVGSHGHTGIARVLLGSVAERVVRYAGCSVLVSRPRTLTARVLVATDFSDPALPALRAAADEVRRIDGKLTAFHAIDLSALDWSSTGASTDAGGLPILADAVARMGQEARARLDQALASVGTRGDGVILEGAPAPLIVKVAHEIEAELIIVGTSGRTGLKRVTLGSVAEAVVRHARTSVLVVRLGATT